MVSAAHIVDLPQSVEQVFAYVSQLERYPEWARRAVEVRRSTAGPVEEGTAVTIVNRVPGRTFDVDYRVTRVEPGRRLVFAGGPRNAQAEFTFLVEPNGSGSRLTERVEMRFGGPWRLAGPVIAWMSKLQLALDHRRLRRALDSQTRRPAP